jgi:putative Mg2+ transporter-C (MgtC) family protein
MSDVWQQISNTFIAEFSDLKDVTEITTLTIRLLMAALLGGNPQQFCARFWR